MAMEKIEKDTIEIEMEFNSPVQRVWKAWTDPAIILSWFGSDPNGCGVSATVDARPMGTYEVTFKNSDQAKHTCSGMYLEVIEFNKLIFSWEWKNEPGVESRVTVTLATKGCHTVMKFLHAGVGTASIHDYVAGWQGAFSKLVDVLSIGDPVSPDCSPPLCK